MTSAQHRALLPAPHPAPLAHTGCDALPPPPPPKRLPCHCSEKALEGMCEALYNDSVKVLKQAALFLLSQEEEERDGPPGGLPCG